MTDIQIKELAADVWKQIGSAYHWGDGFTDAHFSLHAALRKAAGKKKLSCSELRDIGRKPGDRLV